MKLSFKFRHSFVGYKPMLQFPFVILISVQLFFTSETLSQQISPHPHPHGHSHDHNHHHDHSGDDHGHYRPDKEDSDLNKMLNCHANFNALPTTPACNNHLSYAPQSGFEGHTPIKEVKLVMHVIQQEPPLDPGNYTDDPAHIAFFQSLVHDPNVGFNARFANLCSPLPVDPNNPSPHIDDSRIRFLFDGIPGQDLLFHQDNNAYDGGFNHSSFGGNNVQIGPTCTVYDEIIENNANLSADQRNALHILWIQCATFNGSTECNTLGGLGFPDRIEGIPFVGQQGFFFDPPPVIDHNLTRGIAHELAVALGLFHAWVGDFCDDTPQGAFDNVPNNYMGHHVNANNPNDRCSFTQCQLARMHYVLETTYSAILRNTDKCGISEPDLIIRNGEDVFWNSPRRICSNVVVEAGARLTITCDIGMPENSRITVETGGRLLVDGARIYNSCGPWDGIVVEGDVNADQTSIGGLKQGHIQLNPGSVIEGAFIGVRLFDPANPQHTAGGIISANGATFLNNTGGVAITRYQGTNPFTGNPLGYSATFSGCSFLVNGDMGGGIGSFSYMASLQGVDGVRFNGCTFANEIPTDGFSVADDRGYGILANDAGFSAVGKCLGNTLPCQSYQKSAFRGFQTAIFAQNKGATASTFMVSRADFENNARGIVSSSVHNVFVVLNNFKVGMRIPYQFGKNPFVGIQVLRGTGFTIEENELEPDPNLMDGMKAVGITIISSGPEPNEVYKNTLDKLFTGNLANGSNRSKKLPEQGLQYLCNSHSINEFDIAVPGITGFSGNIAEDQGSNAESGGNTFTAAPMHPEGHISNTFDPIDYFCTKCPTNVTPMGLVTLTPVVNAHSCPSNLLAKRDGRLTESEKQQVATDFNNSVVGSERARLANMLVQQALVDSNGIDLPEARIWLANKGGLEAEFMTVDTWLHEGNTATAQQVLNNIPNNYELTGENLTEYQLFNQYKNLQVNAIQNDLSDEQVLLANQAAIQQIAAAGNYYASVQAQGLINSVLGLVYDPVLILPNPTTSQSTGGVGTGTEMSIVPHSFRNSYLTAMPNPTKGQTAFIYRLPEGSTNGTLTVTSIEGRVIKSFGLSENEGRQVWDTSSVPEGIYLFSLVVDGKNTFTERLSIIR